MCRSRRLLEIRDRLLARRAFGRLEHRRVRCDCEEVLRQPVVDLPRNTRALLRDCAPELRMADCPPGADHQHAVGDHAQEVPLRHVVAAEQRREQVVQRREQH